MGGGFGDKPKDTVIDVISRGEECYLQGLGMYNPRKVRGRPEAKEVLLLPSELRDEHAGRRGF